MNFRYAAVIAVFCLSASAQQRPTSALGRQPGIESLPAPQPIGQVAAALSGTWSITVSKVDRDGREAVSGLGQEVWKFEPGAVFVEENRSTINGKPAEDYAALWWDRKAQKIRGTWCNAEINDEGCSGFDISIEGNDIEMNGIWEMRGKRFTWREVFTVSAAGELTQKLHTAEAGKDLRLVEIIRGTDRCRTKNSRSEQ